MAKEERVNLRLTSEVYEPYAQLAQVLGMSVAQVMRDCLAENLEVVQTLLTMARKQQAGDEEGAKTVYGTMITMYRTYLDHQEAMGVPTKPEEYFRSGEEADRSSNTVR